MSEREQAAEGHEVYEELLTDYLDGALPEEKRARVEEHLEECAECRGSLDELKKTVEALSGLHKMSAPQDFDDKVERTIERRSAGRFFGRKAFGDRIPFELLALLALLLAVGIFVLLRFSHTGSLDLGDESHKPEMSDHARDVVPKP